MGNRRKARELAVQVLFHMEFSPGDPDEIFDLICENFNSSKSIRAFSRILLKGVCKNKEYLDKLIRQSSENWRLERMSILDRSIIRLGTFELLFMEDIPPKVSIDEAVELGKRYGTDESKSFINGILDNIFENIIHRRI
jgi:transcription antitermination factor NusB